MALSENISKLLSNFERYNNKEIYRIGKMDGFNFTVTGRLVSGATGFFVIVLLLIITFSTAANSIMVSNIDGVKAFTAEVDVNLYETTPLLSGTLDEGESFSFGHLVEDVDWDYVSPLNISHFDVVVDWNADGGAGGGRQVSFEVSSKSNNSNDPETDGGPGGTIIIPWQVNSNISLNSESVSGSADTAEQFLLSFEEDGDWMGGTFTFTQASTGSIIFSESVNYEITLNVYTWTLKNVEEVVVV